MAEVRGDGGVAGRLHVEVSAGPGVLTQKFTKFYKSILVPVHLRVLNVGAVHQDPPAPRAARAAHSPSAVCPTLRMGHQQ